MHGRSVEGMCGYDAYVLLALKKLNTCTSTVFSLTCEPLTRKDFLLFVCTCVDVICTGISLPARSLS